MANKKIAIVGATGYTGSELVRILTYHNEIDIVAITSETYKGDRFSDIHRQFKNFADQKLISVKDLPKKDIDLVFLALPHRVSMDFVAEHGTKHFKIVDLSADFRLQDHKTYEKWYKTEHKAKDYIKKAAYGLPELFRNKIRPARLVANPGCYPTSAILALAPLMKGKLIKKDHIYVDSKSGVTGAGAKPKGNTHFPEVFGNFSAYGISTHRHTPEISEALKNYSGMKSTVLFTPHLLPIDRGILTTTYSQPAKPLNKDILTDTMESFYKNERYVRVVNQPPSVKNVRGSNFCDVYVDYDERTNTVITVSVIDNLVKGAAGQAVQNMNLMLDFLENTGLKMLPLSP
jgi:N-acetyl-gamma-glutamyl-phosphate reductase